MRNLAPTLAKIGVSVALLAFLGWRASLDPNLPALINGRKDWTMLGFAFVVVLAAVLITILRWFLLLRTLGLQFTLGESLRAGCVAYLFNLLPLGLAGSDAVKAGFLIHRNPQHKTEAIASVLIDRVLGLYALLVVAGAAALMIDFNSLEFRAPEDRSRTILLCRLAQYLGIGVTIAFGLMLIPGAMNLPLWDKLEHVRGVGKVLKKLLGAMRTYRQASGRLLVAVLMSFAVHSLYVSMVYFAGRGLMSPQPPLSAHFVFVPLCMVAGALPIGAFEATLAGLYFVFSPSGVPASQGFLIALTYRVLQIAVALNGVVYYFVGRAEVKQVLAEAEEAEEAKAALIGK